MPAFTADYTMSDLKELVRADVFARFPGANINSVELLYSNGRKYAGAYDTPDKVHVEFSFGPAEVPAADDNEESEAA